jgi:hypothetical protein
MLDGPVKNRKPGDSSFRRRPESSIVNKFWIPAEAGVMVRRAFYEAINVCKHNNSLLSEEEEE